MTTLYLTPDELALVQALPAALRDSCTIEHEDLHFEDSERHMQMRCEMLTVSDPALLAAQKAMEQAETEESLIEIMQSIDFDGVSDRDMGELLFAMGPDWMGLFIRQGLSGASTTEHVQSVADATHARHLLLESLQPA